MQNSQGAYVAFQSHVQISLNDFREVASGGTVSNIVANGGLLASDTTPILGAESTKSMMINWAAGNSDIIQAQIALPPNFDGRADASLDLWILTDNAGGGGIDAGTFSVVTSWDNNTAVTDTATDSVPATTFHKITAIIAASDIPDTASVVNIQLTLNAHANDPIHLLGARLNYLPRVTE
jgi:hypothetical protein